MAKEDIRKNVLEKINEAIHNACADRNHAGEELCVMVDIPYDPSSFKCGDYSLFDKDDISNIQLDNATVIWQNIGLLPYPILKVTGIVKG